MVRKLSEVCGDEVVARVREALALRGSASVRSDDLADLERRLATLRELYPEVAERVGINAALTGAGRPAVLPWMFGGTVSVHRLPRTPGLRL